MQLLGCAGCSSAARRRSWRARSRSSSWRWRSWRRAKRRLASRRAGEAAATGHGSRRSRRGVPLPDHLPREVVIVHAPACACPACGGALRRLGEDMQRGARVRAGALQGDPARPADCRAGAARRSRRRRRRSLPIERGRPGPGLLAHLLVNKYCDHLPLYRQAEIFAREGVDLGRSTLADWVGQAAFAACARWSRRSPPCPGGRARSMATTRPCRCWRRARGKTKTGRLWVYVRDERPCGGPAPPAAFYRYSPDRNGEHPRAISPASAASCRPTAMPASTSSIRADRQARLTEVACWAHVRRKFFDLHAATARRSPPRRSSASAALYRDRGGLRGWPADERASVPRTPRARPLLEELKAWLEAHPAAGSPPRASSRSPSAMPCRRWTRSPATCDDGRLEIDNNAAERAIRPLALGRKNYLFAGSDAAAGAPPPSTP